MALTPGGSDSTSRGVVKYCVEITTVRIPGGRWVGNPYCTDVPDCCPVSLPESPPPSGSGDSDDLYGVGGECSHSWVLLADDYGSDGGSESCPEPDPNCPPDWWLTNAGHALVGIPSSPYAVVIGQLMLNAVGQGCPPTGATGYNEIFWADIVNRWQLYLSQNPGAVDAQCLGIEPTGNPSPNLFLKWARVRLPPGSRVIRKRCVIMSADEVCQLCQ